VRSMFARLALVLSFASVCAVPAAADVTVTLKWTLVNGDTLTRANYYAHNKVRITAPDGREYMFDAKTDSVTVIRHDAQMYWTGHRAHADSMAREIMNANRQGVPSMEVTDPVAWGERIAAFNDSIKIEPTGKRKKIAGYPTDEWVLTAGSFLHNEQWIARSLVMPNYGPEMKKTITAAIKDPLGRTLMRLLIDSKEKEGLALAAKTSFRTLSREGSFEYEAITAKSGKIPAAAWQIPQGYARFVK